MRPALCKSADDLIEYWGDGSETVDPHAQKGYSERFIHGELFKRFSDVQCVVHSHAEAVVPYAVSDVPLVPVYHMGGFMGGEVPVWNIAPLYEDDYHQDMLVNNAKFGASLGAAFSDPSVHQHTSPYETTENGDGSGAKRNVVVMKRHGCTTHGKDIPTAVYRAIYTLIHAGVLTNAINIENARSSSGQAKIGMLGLGERHSHDCQIMTEAAQGKSWRLWCHEVKMNPMYQNEIRVTY